MTTNVLGVDCGSGLVSQHSFHFPVLSMVPVLSTTPGACSPEAFFSTFLRENELSDPCSVSYWAVTGTQGVGRGFGIGHQLVLISIHPSSHFQRYLVPLEGSAVQTGRVLASFSDILSPSPHGHLLSSLRQFCYFLPLLLPLSV